MPDYQGTSGNDTFYGADDLNQFLLEDGGSDTAYGNLGEDSFYFGATFDETDHIDGGGGFVDFLILRGEYSRQLTISGSMVTNVSNLVLAGAHEYNLKLAADLLPTQGLIISASTVEQATIRLNGSEMIGFSFYSGISNSRLIGSSGSDALFLMAGARVGFDGGEGFNLIGLYNATRGATVDLAIVDTYQNTRNGLVSLRNVSRVDGTPFADRLFGEDGNNMIIGAGGSDKLYGRGGDDFIMPVLGISSTDAAAARNFIDGGDGTDLVSFLASHYLRSGVTVDLNSRQAQDTGYGTIIFRSVENLSGSNYDDTITGDRNANALFGGRGVDHLFGGNSNDMLWGDAISFFSAELGTFAVNPVDGGWFGDTLDGGVGDDWIDGGGGDDVIIGGRGADILIGGAGNDLFVYNEIKDSTAHKADTIRGFETGDRIDLSGIDADSRTLGDNAFHLGRTDDRAGDLVVDYLHASDQTRIRLYIDGDNRADGIIYLDGQIPLTEANFVF